MEIESLRPYQSVVLAQVREGEGEEGLIRDSMGNVRSVLRDDGRYRARSEDVLTQASGFDEIGLVHYLETRPAAWSSNPEIVDELNHLIVLLRRGRLMAVYCSDQAKRQALLRQFDQEGDGGLRRVQKIPTAVLNAAFVRGTARTLWLTGTHTRVSVKADNKVLTGIDLRDALDPLEDQTFHFTSARCAPPGDEPIGSSPRSSSVWKGMSREWSDFADAILAFFDEIEGVASPTESPFPVLAIETHDLNSLSEAFDISILPAEILSDITIDPQQRADLQELSDQVVFEITETHGASARAHVRLGDARVGEISLEVGAVPSGDVLVEVDGTPVAGEEEALERIIRAARRSDWLKVRYESGHTLVDGAIYEIRHRDVPFDGYDWVDLDGYNVTKEKPSDLAQIGAEDSLFDWVQKSWPPEAGTPRGWLACDDGSMEIADFIHLDVDATPPLLSLIHVKGAKSSSAGRGVSVSAYEVVTSQAVKNLRHLDQVLLDEGLREGLGRQVSTLVWHDGSRRNRNQMLEALGAVGSAARQVVIFQPHLSKTQHDAARANPGTAQARRLVQLDTLLLGAEASCHALGARLVVFGDGTNR